MTDLIDYIDDKIVLCIAKGKAYGLCRLLKDDKGEPYPATYGERAEKVTPLDKWPVLWYHRLLDGEITDSDTFSFGRHPDVLNSQKVRLVVVVDFKEGETVIDDIINAIPENILGEDLTDLSEDYKYVEVNPAITLIRDRESIWETEWGNAYKDKYQMRSNIYAIEYAIDYIKCSECVSN